MANILGINLSELSKEETLKKIGELLNSDQGHFIVTPNPEIILASHHDEEFFHILNQADLAIADGFGLKIAGWILGKKVPRITGADLTLDLLKQANEQGIKILILNWQGGLSTKEEIKVALREQYPKLNFLVLDISRDILFDATLKQTINEFAPTILFNTLGFPYQEKSIFHNLKSLATVRLALGIGGSFDFITGKIRRAPKLMRNLGLEWLWRLFKQPKRLKRIYNATFVFTGKLILSRFIIPHLYRPNVACWLYKKEAGRIKVLIVERVDEPGHWQLPQGGRDGERVPKAGARELQEETGVTKLITKGVFKNLYRYSFPPQSDQDKYRGSRRYQLDYKGQNQSLYIAEFTGSDSDIKINYWDHQAWQWIDVDQLLATLHPLRQPGAKIYLAKFQSLKNI